MGHVCSHKTLRHHLASRLRCQLAAFVSLIQNQKSTELRPPCGCSNDKVPMHSTLNGPLYKYRQFVLTADTPHRLLLQSASVQRFPVSFEKYLSNFLFATI